MLCENLSTPTDTKHHDCKSQHSLLFIQGQQANNSIPGEIITESNADYMQHN